MNPYGSGGGGGVVSRHRESREANSLRKLEGAYLLLLSD